jgi:hypothetical protein
MKLKQIAAACAIACASAPAFAVTAFETPDLTVYLSGATAPDNFLQQIATGIFTGTQGTDWHAYSSDIAGAAIQQRAFFGQMKTTAQDATIPAALSGLKVLFIKRSTGGSVFGVNPVARAQALATIKVTAANCNTTSVPAGFNFVCPVLGVDPGVGAPTGDEVVPDFGVSDVGPALFKQPLNVEFGASQLTPAEVAGMTVKQVNTLAMGYAVTNAIPASTYLSKAHYGAMLSGNLADWTQIDAALAPAAGTQVLVCRRVPGSGTQTSYNWYFNNFPCTTSSIAGSGSTQPTRMADSASGVVSGSGTALDPFVIDPTAGYTVIENSTSGDVRNCLSKAAAGGVHTFKDEEGKSYSVDFGTGGYGAIGVLSVDSLASARNPATVPTGWSFRAENGAGAYFDGDTGTPTVPTVSAGATGTLPTKADLLEGNYEFASELTMQYRSTLAGTKKTFADFFIARAGDPSFNTSAWVAALPPTFDPTTTANVAKATRFGNQCSPLQRLF